LSETGSRVNGTMALHYALLEKDENYKNQRLEIEKFTYQDVKRSSTTFSRLKVVTIPTVVHIIYSVNEQNISDEQVFTQIRVLNQDFRKLNNDTELIPEVFKSKAGDAAIEFQLATVDPNGNRTNGITRTQTNVSRFDMDFSTIKEPMKFSNEGGKDAWPATSYLNIWVCNLGSNLLGYAQFPGGKATTDGVVINYKNFGTMGTAVSPFDGGRTATHEVGHWLNLLHIWGDDVDSCKGSDNVADTPNQEGPNYGDPTFPHVTCQNAPNGDMFMNFMDYSNDACMHMFTKGQIARMRAALNGPRSSLLNSTGLSAPRISPEFGLIRQDFGIDSEQNAYVFDGTTWIPKEDFLH